MVKDLVVCFDGTSNRFGTNPTNVARLAASAANVRPDQSVFYDPGVGTLPQPGFVSALGRWWSVVIGLAFGAGLSANVADGYAFLMRNYEAGDRIWIFGFSRGAYTARVLAGVLCEFGLLARDADNLMPYVMDMARAAMRADSAQARDAYWTAVREFSATFARSDAAPHARPHAVQIHFLGVWDTVSSLGWVWDAQTFPFTATNPAVIHVRHAIALDERRAFFRQNRVRPQRTDDEGTAREVRAQDLVQLWFAGCHCDVGGGNAPAASGAWQDAYDWMTGEAADQGLGLAHERIADQHVAPKGAAAGWRAALVESMHVVWWLAEVFPKLSPDTREPWWLRVRVNLFSPRELDEGDVIAPAVVERMRTTSYVPRQLSSSAVARIRALPAAAEPVALGADDVGERKWSGKFRELVFCLGLLGAAATFYLLVMHPATRSLGSGDFFAPRIETAGAGLHRRLLDLGPSGRRHLAAILRHADRVFPALCGLVLFAWAVLGAKWLRWRSQVVGVLLALPVAAVLFDYAENSALMEAIRELHRPDGDAAMWAARLTSAKCILYGLSLASAALLVVAGFARTCIGRSQRDVGASNRPT